MKPASFKRLSIILFSLCAYCLPTVAQRARISFDSRHYQFGKVEESRGKTAHSFLFTNNGDRPLVIRKVESDCGCAVARWDRKPVNPGETGRITVTFDPRNRPGRFSKKIVVHSNAAGSPSVSLRISGEVIAGKVDLEKEYPVAIGSLRLATDTLFWQETAAGEAIIPFWNSGKKRITFRSIAKPDYLAVDYSPLIILPGDRGNLQFIPLKEGAAPAARPDRIILRTDEGYEGTLIIVKKQNNTP